MVNKSELIKKIANLIEEKKIINIRDIRDESDKKGMTITIDLKKEANPKSILNQLYKYTDLEKYFHVNAIALIDDGLQPELLSLKDILREFLEFRKIIIFRRTQFLLRKAKERLHILEGLKTALDHIDEIIEIIKKSESREDASLKLCKAFKFTEIQATVILETKLQAIAKLEKIKILNELKEKQVAVTEYEGIIKDQKRIVKIMKQEFIDIKEKFNDERRTKVVKGMPDKIEEDDLIPEEDVLITLSQNGYIKRMNANIFKTQQRGGKGIAAYNGGENDLLEHILTINTKDNLLFFSDKGKVYQTRAYDINDASRESKGKAIQNFIDISGDEKVSVVLGYNKEIAKNKKYLIMATQNGVIKKTELSEFQNIRKNGLLSIKLDKDDLLK
jgi:DNA gyrase subunit A